MPRIAVAQLFHEGNSFTPSPPLATTFRVWASGDAEARALFAGAGTEIGAALDFLDARPHWRATFLRLASAGAAGPVRRAAFEAAAGDILAGLAHERFDAVYLVLHGAMVLDDEPRGDLELLRRVRATIGPDTLLVASFDLHANMDPAITALLDFAAGYKTHPHVDGRETAQRVLETLERMLATGLRPRGALAQLGAILPSINMRTDGTGPMAELAALARSVEAAPDGVLDATIYGGFSHADTPCAGASVMVYAETAAAAEQAATELVTAFRARRDRFYISLPGPEEGIAGALRGPGFPAAVTDAADNPGSGGMADTPALLRAVLDAAPTVPVVFAYFADPALVERARQAGLGGRIAGTLGGRLTDAFGGPLPFAGTVERLTDGAFRCRGPVATGTLVEFGPTALLALSATPGGAQVRVIVTSRVRTTNDPGLLDLHGVDIQSIAVYCVKAKNHFRAAFTPLLARIIDVDAPGPAALDISGFPFRHAPATLYPLSARRARSPG